MSDDIHALDSRAVLGLLTKASQMFSSDDTTLSFPIGTPLAFNAEQLVQAMGPAPDASGHALLSEFSTVLNFIPAGPIWPPANPASLDDIVREVINAEWALAEWTPEEESRYAAARAQVDLANPEMARYASLKDAWIRAREQLANEPDNPAAEELERATHLELVAFPARARIERAMQDLVALDERAPHRTRDRLEREIGVGKGTFDNPSGGRFSPARLLPRAVLTSAGWDAVTLDQDDLAGLSATAPPELTRYLIVDTDETDPIERISFEYASALVHRTWFDGSVFQLKCWRFFDQERLLSDGQAPPQGECPWYVHAVVLARNVAVTVRRPPDTGGDASPPPPIDFLVPDIEDVWVIPPPVDPIPEPVEPEPFPIWVEPDPEPIEPERVVPIEPEPFPDPTGLMTLEPFPIDTHLVAMDDTLRLSHYADRGFEQPTDLLGEILVEPDFSRRFVAADWGHHELVATDFLVEAMKAPNFDLIPIIAERPASSPPPDSANLVTKTTPPGTIIVLAFICKAVPRSPQPSPGAVWHG